MYVYDGLMYVYDGHVCDGHCIWNMYKQYTSCETPMKENCLNWAYMIETKIYSYKVDDYGAFAKIEIEINGDLFSGCDPDTLSSSLTVSGD